MTYLALEDGTIVQGKPVGNGLATSGELVFTTAYTGYEEALTDPSYRGQILLFTYPLLGNYGVRKENFQSDQLQPEGMVAREICKEPSHRSSGMDLIEFLNREGKMGLESVDTRMLTLKLRERGVMKAGIGKSEEKALDLMREQNDLSEINLVEQVTCEKPWQMNNGKELDFVLIDTGVKRSILKNLAKRANLTVLPESTTVKEIQSYKPDALFLSNGPGDPKKAENAIDLVEELVGEIPLFGICLGHQIIALAMGAETFKLKFGHRGSNQPVKNLESGKVFVTSQNHGFAVSEQSLERTDLTPTQLNLNDRTVEASQNEYLNVYSVQYHPEANPGPRDAKPFFDQVVKVVKDAS